MAVTRMRFYGSTGGVKYVDLARELSKQNRKLHRQKQIYTVLGGYYVDSQGSRIDFNVAPHTWVTKRAINRGFAVWRKHVAKTLEHTEGAQSGKYSDFKVRLNYDHSLQGTNQLSVTDASNGGLPGGEWDYSTLVSDDPDTSGRAGDQFDLHIVGQHVGNNPDWSGIGLMKSWLDSRPSPVSEDQPRNTSDLNTDPLNNLYDSSDTQDDRLGIISDENDQQPYDEFVFFGIGEDNSGVNHNLQRVGTAFTVNGSVALSPVPGFQAICGLIQLEITANSAWELVLDVESVGESF